MRDDLSWWLTELPHQYVDIIKPPVDFVIESDSCDYSWGAVANGQKVGGAWSHTEQQQHINYKELLASFYAVKTFCRDMKSVHVHIFVDNTMALAYLHKKGGKVWHLNELAREIWFWLIERRISITVSHIKGEDNTDADAASRLRYDSHTEWQLNPKVFTRLLGLWGTPVIDCFASRINAQINQYFSWQPDPNAIAIDAYNHDWPRDLCYAFPPFSQINRVLWKIKREKVTYILIAPFWPTQTWFAPVLHMLADSPVRLPPSKEILVMPQNQDMVHPIHQKLKLTCFLVSGSSSRTREYQQRLNSLSCLRGDNPHTEHIPLISKNGADIVILGKQIPSRQMYINL